MRLKTVFEPVEDRFEEHRGKKFKVVKDVTDPELRNDPETYGYVRNWLIRLEDGTELVALEVEVEHPEEPLEVTLDRVGDMVDVYPIYGGGDPVQRKLRHDTYTGFYVIHNNRIRPVRQLQFDQFIFKRVSV